MALATAAEHDGIVIANGLLLTERLRLEPVTIDHADDLWTVHNDDDVARWYAGWKPTLDEAVERAEAMSRSWRAFGAHKWMAYRRDTGDLVGRGGVSPTPVDDDWGRVKRFLPEEAWTREATCGADGETVHANWVEIGWALLREFWGRGYATEIGRAGLGFAFESLNARAVVSCTDQDNIRSRAVMGRLGMTYAGILDDLAGGADLAVYTRAVPPW